MFNDVLSFHLILCSIFNANVDANFNYFHHTTLLKLNYIIHILCDWKVWKVQKTKTRSTKIEIRK